MQKYAIVTGCAKGIGREIAEELARFGYNIIGTYNKSINEMNSLKKKVDFIGVKFDMIKLDLLDDLSINSFLDYIKSKYKKIDKYFTEVTEEDKKLIKVNEDHVVKFIVEHM